jgi:hypothetical protein
MKITVTIQEFTPHGVVEFAFQTDGRPAEIQFGDYIYTFNGIYVSLGEVKEEEK